MLEVRVTNKFYDKEKGILVGYTIQDVNGKTLYVTKEQLKSAVISGQCKAVNMTLTSDGRLIGSARNKPVKHREPKTNGILASCVFTNGKNIACVMIDKKEFMQRSGVTHPTQYEELPLYASFDTGIEANDNIKNNNYDNIKIVDGKVDFNNTKKKSYKQLKTKLLKILEANNIHTSLEVEKGTEKYEYKIIIKNYDVFSDLDEMVQIVYVLIENAMYDAKIKPAYIDDGIFYVKCMTGINDVRKALKSADIHNI